MQKQYRLKSRSAFNYIYKRGSSVAVKELVLLSVKTRLPMKVGFSVSKKVGKSVVRNRVKRLLREAFTPLIDKVDGGHNYVVVARSAIVGRSLAEVRESLLAALNKAGKLK